MDRMALGTVPFTIYINNKFTPLNVWQIYPLFKVQSSIFQVPIGPGMVHISPHADR